MAGVHEEARTSVYVDGSQAKNVINELTQEAEKYKQALIKANEEGDLKAFKAAKKDLERVTKEMQKLEKEAFDVNKVLEDLNGASISDLYKAQRKLNKELRSPGLKRNSDQWNELKEKLIQVKTELKNVREDMSVTTESSEGLIQSVKGLLPAFSFAAIFAGFGAIGKKIFDLSQQTLEYRKTVSDITGLTGKELANTTAGIEATSKTFKKEVSDLTIANNTLAKTFKISQQEATDLIDKGFIEGADASGEFIDMLKEYPVQFKAAGLSAEESIALMSQSVKEGVYSDKGADVIKEGTLRLREMTKATREAINGIGLSSTELEADLKKGTITYFEAIQKVSNKLKELPPQSATVGSALADIFGGPGEDAGLEYVKMLGNVDKGLQSINTTTTESQSVQKKLLESNQRLTKAWSNLLGTGTSMFTSIKAGINNMLSGTLEAFTSMENYTRSEMKRVNMLAIEMTDANTPVERRNELYAELKRIAPDVVANIDKENISVSTLRSNLEKYNEVMIKKLALQDSESALDKEREKAGEATSERVEKEMQLREELYSIQLQAQNKFSKWKGNENIANQIEEINLSSADVIDKYKQINDLLGKQAKFYNTNAGGLIGGIVEARKAEKDATDSVNKAMESYMKRYELVFGKTKKQSSPVPTKIPELNSQPEVFDYSKRLEELENELNKGLITIEEYEAKRDWLELTNLEKSLLTKKKAGEDTIALEQRIADKRLSIQKGISEAISEIEKELEAEEKEDKFDPSVYSKKAFEEAKARIEAAKMEREAMAESELLEAETEEEEYQARIELENIRFEEELLRIGDQNEQKKLAKLKHEEELDAIDQQYAQKRAMRFSSGLHVTNNLLSSGASFFEAQKQRELAAAGDNAEKREKIEKKYAEKQKKIAISQALIAGALGIMQIWATKTAMISPFAEIYKAAQSALLVGTTAAQVATIQSQQFARGKYPIKGTSDGKTYQAQYTPSLKTGVYSQPSIGLFSEIDPEMVVDGATTKKLMFDYPEVYDGILSLSRGGTPQFADGKYPDPDFSNQLSEQKKTLSNDDNYSSIQIATLQQLNTTLKKGIRAYVIYGDITDKAEEISRIEEIANS